MLALDSDLVPGLAVSLGVGPPAAPPLSEAAEQDESGRWRLRRGIGPVRAVRRYATRGPDGVLLLQCGKVAADGTRPDMPALQAYYRVIHRLAASPAFASWAIVGDLSAGPRQTAFDWAPYARTYLVVVEPSWKSALTARRVIAIARSRGGDIRVIANKVAGREDERFVSATVREPLAGSIPLSDGVRDADRMGAALVDRAPGSRAVRAIEEIADRLAG